MLIRNNEALEVGRAQNRTSGTGLLAQFDNHYTNVPGLYQFSSIFSCEVDTNTHILSQTDHETKFVFRIFEMTGHQGDVDIKCEATICDTSDALSSKQCDQHCI